MNRTPRTIAGLVTTAVLSAGLVTVAAPASTAAPTSASPRCDQATQDYRVANSRYNEAGDQIRVKTYEIRRIDRQRAALGDSAADRRRDAQLRSLRRKKVDEREQWRVVRAQQKTKRTQAAARIEKYC